MKRIITFLCGVIFLVLSLSGCASGVIGSSTIDVDLTQLSSNMVYSEVYNMMMTPEDYSGKTVKMQGQFSVFEDEMTGSTYYACIIADATACCQQGLEFVPTGDYAYPDDFPKDGDEVVVVGTFETYSEGDLQYCHLIDSQFTPL